MNLFHLNAKIPSWAKWLALTLLLLVLLISPFTHRAERKKCQQICVQQGFAGFRFKPYFHEKTGPKPASCHCLTEEESQMKKRIPLGTKVY